MPAGAVPFPFGKCRICKDKATGIHYGVATCEGCKGFFKRSTVRGEKYKCFFGGNCEVTPKNRNRCKSCRFKLCLSMGMSIEAVKMGRIPKVEKEKALRASFEDPDLADDNEAEGSSSTKTACDDLFNVQIETDAMSQRQQTQVQSDWYDQGVSTRIVGTGSQRMCPFSTETRSCSQQIDDPNVADVVSQITDNVLKHMNIDESMIGCSSEQAMVNKSSQVCNRSQLRKVVGNQHLGGQEEDQNSSRGLGVQTLDSFMTGNHLSNTISALSSANVVLQQDQMHEFAMEGQGQNQITGMKSHAGNRSDSIFQDNQSSTGTFFVKTENSSLENTAYQGNPNVLSLENREIRSDPIRGKTEFKSNDLNQPSSICQRPLITKCVESDDCLKDYDAESAQLIRNTTKRFEKAFEALYDDMTMDKREQIKEYFANKRTMRHTLTDAEEVKFVWGLLIKAIAGSVNNRIVSFCGEVPGFINVCPADRAKLSKRAYLEIWLLTAAEFFQDNESYLIIGDGIFYSRATMCVIMNEIIVDKMFAFAEKLNEFRLTDFEIAIICAIQLTTADQLVLDEPEAIKELNSHYLDILAFVVNKNRPIKGSRLLIDLFRLIPKLVEISKFNARILEKSSLEGPIADQESCRCVLDE